MGTLLAFSNASLWEAGPCPPKPEVVTPLEPERYLGDWYSVYETPMPYTTQENTCNRYQYGPLPQGVNNISLYMTTTRADSSIGEAPCAWMQPVTPMRPTGDVLLYMGEVGAPSWIIDTDYDSFARNGIEMNDWYPIVHTEDCIYDNDQDRWCK